MNRKFNILYVDDEVSNLNVFKNTFRREYNIFTAESAQAGINTLEHEKIDLILADQRMPEMTGVEFLKKIISKYPEPNRILITAFTDFGALKDAVNEAKIFQYIQKPWDKKSIQETINSALEIYSLKQKNLELTKELKTNNKELVRLNNELLELDKLKFQFLDIISHEIRTPLNGLVGATSIFKEALDKENFKKYEELFKILELSTQRLEHFLLLATRITSFKINKRKVNFQLINPKNLITKTVDRLKTKLEEKNIDLKITVSNNGNEDCYAEKLLIEICLIEIIENAIKYTEPNGEINIRNHTDDKNTYIEIVDTGPGFPEIVMKNLFKPFVTDYDIRKQGMGLDLALIKLIIEAHNGAINIKNNENGGAFVQLIFSKMRQ